ncbi:MAG: caspase family protein [candidate division WOR-3 bacterium]
MRYFLIILLLINCSIKYIEKIEKVSEPNNQEPYLTLKYQKSFKKIPYSLPILTTISGIGTSIFLKSKGYVMLSKEILALSLLSSTGMVGYNMRKSPKDFIPKEPFKVKLEGTDYITSFPCDDKGFLKINILEFAPFYKEGTDFKLTIISPENKNLGSFSVNTEKIKDKLVKARMRRYPPELIITSFSFDDSTGDKDMFLDADEKGRIVLTIKNKGKGIAEDLEVKITPINQFSFVNIPRSIKIDNINIMEEKRIIIPISAEREVPNQELSLKIEVLEPYFQADAEPVILKFETRKFEPPNLILYDKGVEEGEIVANKSANISLVIYNQGKGRAEDVECEVKVPEGVKYLGEVSKFYFGNMEPMAWQKIDFPIFVGARYKEDSLKINLIIKEKREEFSKNIILSFPLNKPIKRPKEIVFKGKEEMGPYLPPPPTLTVDVDVNIPKTNMDNPYGVAVIIGNKLYEHKDVPDVDYADNDARIVKEYLIKTLGYKEDNIIFILNGKKSDFDKVFGTERDYKGQLYNYVEPNKSDVFIYYSGHGAPDIETKSGYFLPVEADPNYVKITGYPLETFFKNLSQIKARSITVIIDACFSGASERGMLIARASPLTGVVIEKEVKENINLFTSAKEDEISSWYPEKNHSLFTYYFLKGISGDADLDKNREISFGELKEYVSENVSKIARRLNRKQTPQFRGDEKKIIVKY